jgi:hypothetical protein
MAHPKVFATFLVKSSLLVLGTGIAVLGVELGLRLWTPRVLAYKAVGLSDPVFNHAFRPSSKYREITTEYDVEYAINSAGLRDYEYVPTTADEFRIVMLGDSFTEGGGVPVESCFVKIVEYRLNAEFGHSRRFTVFNFGIPSYSPILEYLLLKEKALSLHPNLVVLNFDMTDVQDDFMYGQDADFDSLGVPIAVHPSIPSYGFVRFFPRGIVQTSLHEHSYLFSLLSVWVNGLKPAQQIRSGDITSGVYSHTLDSSDAPWRRYFDQSESYIHVSWSLCSKHHIPFVLTVYPTGHQVSDLEWVIGRSRFGLGLIVPQSAIFKSLAIFARRDSIPFLDMTPAFRERSNGRLYFRQDRHWTPSGHQVAADTLTQFLLSRVFASREFNTYMR